MNDLTLFILYSMDSARDNWDKASESIRHPCKVVQIPATPGERLLDQKKRLELFSALINDTAIDTDWYGILYADEYLSAPLAESLEICFSVRSMDVVICFKRIRQMVLEKPQVISVEYTPRFFRKSVKLTSGMLPANWEHMIVEKLLDGFLEEELRR